MSTQSRNLRPPVPEVEPLPQHISNPCRRGDHGMCQGRVLLIPAADDGRRFTRCECPVCKHPAIRTIRIKS